MTIQIKTFDPPLLSSNDQLSEKELLFDLSSIVLSQVDETVGKYRGEMDLAKARLSNLKEQLNSTKNTLINTGKMYNRTLLIHNILTKIEVLKHEGQLVGNNRKKIFEIMDSLDTQSEKSLRGLEDKLSMYVPSIPKMVYA